MVCNGILAQPTLIYNVDPSKLNFKYTENWKWNWPGPGAKEPFPAGPWLAPGGPPGPGPPWADCGGGGGPKKSPNGAFGWWPNDGCPGCGCRLNGWLGCAPPPYENSVAYFGSKYGLKPPTPTPEPSSIPGLTGKPRSLRDAPKYGRRPIDVSCFSRRSLERLFWNHTFIHQFNNSNSSNNIKKKKKKKTIVFKSNQINYFHLI